MSHRIYVLMLITLCFIAGHITPAVAQSESYIDTIYQAVDNLDQAYASDTVIISGNASDTIEIASETAELERVATIIDDLTRIILGKLGGVTLNFKVISCQKIPATGTATGTATITATGTATVTSTSTSTSTATATATVTSTSTATSTATATATVTSTATSTSTATATATVTSTNTSTVTSTSTSTSTATSTSTSTSTSTATDTDDPIDAQKAIMESNYGIEAASGTVEWSEGQLKLANEILEKLPTKFRNSTDVIYRDGAAPEGAPQGATGYVVFYERKIHLLDSSTKLSPAALENLEKALGHPPTTEEQLYQIKFLFQKTLVHEMTHCFQNTYPEIFRDWAAQFWPGDKIIGTCPSEYGKTKPYEDMAESVALYILGGRIENGFYITAYGTKMDMDRYNYIKTNVMEGKEFLKPAVATGTASI